MRIIFTGMFKHAMQLLQGFESDAGLDGTLRILMDAIAKDLSEVGLAQFSGDTILPKSVNPIKNQRQYGNYLIPTVNITTSPRSITMCLTHAPKGLDVS